jgi:light-regulated signal transduction histidine kinase (bacteriophytochrome)
MEQLIGDLLFFSRLGRTDLARIPIDIDGLIAEVRETLSQVVEERNARIVMPLPLPTITCDRVRTAAVFRNLIANAIKYNDSDEPIVEVGFEPLRTYRGDMLHDVFYVRDNGIGIEPQFHEDIFRIFKRLNSEKTYGAGCTFYFSLSGASDAKT